MTSRLEAVSMLGKRRSTSLEVTLSATCAALYAMGSYLTAYTSSPWGSGQFRPAVVIPAVFSTLFGPWIGGVGAAVGTLIADSAKHGFPYIPSLVAAVPGNFIGWYLFGLLMKKEFSWERFIKNSQITLFIANVITAFAYVYYRTFVEGIFPAFREVWVYVSLGFVAWWYVTMLPFVLLVGPPLIRAVASAFPGLAAEKIRSSPLKNEISRKAFSSAMMRPGLFMLLIGIIIAFTDPQRILDLRIAQSEEVLRGMKIMFLSSGIVLLILGIVVLMARKLAKTDK